MTKSLIEEIIKVKYNELKDMRKTYKKLILESRKLLKNDSEFKDSFKERLDNITDLDEMYVEIEEENDIRESEQKRQYEYTYKVLGCLQELQELKESIEFKDYDDNDDVIIDMLDEYIKVLKPLTRLTKN